MTVDTVDVKSAVAVVLQDRNRVVETLEQHLHGFAAELRGVKPVEGQCPPAALRVADFSSKDRLAGRFAAAAGAKVIVADRFDQSLA